MQGTPLFQIDVVLVIKRNYINKAIFSLRFLGRGKKTAPFQIFETTHVSYLHDGQSLKCALISNIIAQVVEDVVRNLGMNRSLFCLLLSDAAKYMIATGITLKSLYPKLFPVTCVKLYCTIVL